MGPLSSTMGYTNKEKSSWVSNRWGLAMAFRLSNTTDTTRWGKGGGGERAVRKHDVGHRDVTANESMRCVGHATAAQQDTLCHPTNACKQHDDQPRERDLPA